MRWPVGLDPEGFLSEYWQQRPLRIDGALPDVPGLLDGDDLAGLACEEAVESRLIITRPDGTWEVAHGPFRESDFASLGERDWTLLVQDVDKHIPEVANVLDAFAFLPRWRLDDVMVSYAAPGGSVGPHVDAYDVFLLQGAGERQWAVDPAPADVSLEPDVPLRLLRSFSPETRYDLATGDVLYLPPGVAHHGVAEVPGMTWSIGFRAPSAAGLLRELARILEEEPTAARYADAGLSPDEVHATEFGQPAIQRALSLIVSSQKVSEDIAARCLGCAVTRVKTWLRPEALAAAPDAGDVLARLAAGGRCRPHPWSRFAWWQDEAGAWLFADGEAWRLTGTDGELVPVLAAAAGFRLCDLGGEVRARALVAVISALLGQGALEWTNDEETIEGLEDRT